jgi:hypothetical protein
LAFARILKPFGNLQLLAVINGWPTPESLAPVFDWFIQALRAWMPG